MTSAKQSALDHRTDRIPIRVSPAQKAVLTEAAQRSALDVSSWLRALGMERAAALGITEASVKVPAAESEDAPVKGKAAPAPARKGKAPARPKG